MRATPIGGRRVQGCALAWLISALACAGAAGAQPLSREPIGAGFAAPTWATHAPGFPRLLFVAEREGIVRAVDLATGATLEPAFLDIDERVIATDEYGLLGLAFHPNFATNGRLYVHYSDTSGDSRISEFSATLDPLLADPESERMLLRVFQPQSNQNGGWIGFSPVDGMLYVGLGDGGGGNDTGVGHTPGTGNAQDLTDNLLGKVLRLDVDGDDFPADAARNYAIPPDNPFVGVTGDDEIWAYGLRNPFRAGFDRATGDLWIGDVGQDNREEVDFQPADSPGGENYGWRLREGSIATPGSAGGPRPPGAVDPVFEYDHDFGEAITGGTVYRGPVAALRGRYVFGDWFFSRIWSFDPANPAATLDEHTRELGEIPAPVGFGEDAVGNLYVVSLGGDVFRIVPEPGAPTAAAAALLALAARRRRSHFLFMRDGRAPGRRRHERQRVVPRDRRGGRAGPGPDAGARRDLAAQRRRRRVAPRLLLRERRPRGDRSRPARGGPASDLDGSADRAPRRGGGAGARRARRRDDPGLQRMGRREPLHHESGDHRGGRAPARCEPAPPAARARDAPHPRRTGDRVGSRRPALGRRASRRPDGLSPGGAARPGGVRGPSVRRRTARARGARRTARGVRQRDAPVPDAARRRPDRVLQASGSRHRSHPSRRRSLQRPARDLRMSCWDRAFGSYVAEPAGGPEGVTIGLPQFREPEHQRLLWMLLNPVLPESGAGGR